MRFEDKDRVFPPLRPSLFPPPVSDPTESLSDPVSSSRDEPSYN